MPSPFYHSRRDYEDKPLIWLPEDFSDLEGSKHLYLTGSRGTGKTYLLRALEWKERLENEHFRTLVSDPFKDRYIGVLLKMPAHQAKNWEFWPAQPTGMEYTSWDELRGDYFAYYLEIVAVQSLCEAMTAMMKRGILNYSVAQESDAVRQVLATRPEIRFFFEPEGEPTLSKLGAAVRAMSESLLTSVQHNSPLEWPKPPLVQPGRFLMTVGGRLLTLCGEIDPTEEESDESTSRPLQRTEACIAKPAWRLKLCIDEAECLSYNQQVTINTLVRCLEQPIFLVVAYAIGKSSLSPEFRKVFRSRQDLTGDDRPIKDLNAEYEEDGQRFAKLVQGVTALRLQRELGDFARQDIDVRRILGKSSLNQLLAARLVGSEGAFAAGLLNDAKSFAEDRYFTGSAEEDTEDWAEDRAADLDDIDDENPLVPRIYEAYIRQKLGLKLDYKFPRTQQSKEFRKRNVAAFLCICREAKMADIPYAGFQMVLHLSQNSIRDFLNIMEAVYTTYGKDPEAFAVAQIDHEKQARALKKASEEKWKSIGRWVETQSPKVIALIHGLGTLLGKIQGDHASPSQSLAKAPEQGIIELVLPPEYAELRRVIAEAGDSGFLSITQETRDMVTFTLHRLFAPKFGFTYRKPQYTLRLAAWEVQPFVDTKEESDRIKLVNNWMDKHHQGSDGDVRALPPRQLSLFDDVPSGQERR